MCCEKSKRGVVTVSDGLCSCYVSVVQAIATGYGQGLDGEEGGGGGGGRVVWGGEGGGGGGGGGGRGSVEMRW